MRVAPEDVTATWLHRCRSFFSGDRGFLLFFSFLSLLLVDFSSKISMMNRSDYLRTAGFMLDKPIDVVPFTGARPAFLWSYLPHRESPLIDNNSAAVYFWLMAKLQGLVNLNFDLYVIAFLSKAIILYCCLRVTLSYAVRQRLSAGMRYLFLTLIAIAFFYSHNIAAVNTLFSEHVFAVGVAIFLAGAFETQRSLRILLTSLGLLLSAASKPQFFYLPILYVVCVLLLSAVKRKRLDAVLISTLAVVQAISLIPLINASTKLMNYYHSLYFGSYKLLTADELRSIGIPKGTEGCIGIDMWGWKMVGQDSIHIVPDHESCHFTQAKITLAQVFTPYVHNPFLLIRLAAWSLPYHFTVHYFEVLPQNNYIRPSNGTSFRNGSVLVAASEAREATVTRMWIVIVVAGIILPFLPGRASPELRTVLLFLSLAVPSQVAACLLGEGVRDLSRHLSGAQLSLDLVSMLCILQIAGYFSARLRKSVKFASASTAPVYSHSGREN